MRLLKIALLFPALCYPQISIQGWTNQANGTVVYASMVSGIHLNGSLTANTGTSDKAALQAVLDTASSTTPLLLIVDGVAAIDSTTTGLTVKSNTEIRCMGWGTGFSWLGGSNLHQQPMLVNANPLGIATPVDTSITIRNCQFNGNHDSGHGGSGQTLPSAMNSDGIVIANVQLTGVKNLVIDNVKTYKAAGYGLWLSNIDTFSVSNIVHDHTVNEFTTDGTHFNGPVTNGSIRNISGTTGDDLLALNADDVHLAIGTCGRGGVYGDNSLAGTVKSGAITHVTVDGIHPTATFEAFRVLSATSLVSDLQIKNVDGTVYGQWFSIDMFSSCFASPNLGNFGTVGVENVDLDLTAGPQNGGSYVRLEGHYRQLKFAVSAKDRTIAQPIFDTLTNTNIKELRLDVQSTGTIPGAILKVDGGTIKNLIFHGTHDANGTTTQSTEPVIWMNGGTVTTMAVSGFYEYVDNVVAVIAGALNTLVVGPGRHDHAGSSNGSVRVFTGQTLPSAIVSGWATKLFKSGSGTITNTYAGISTDSVSDSP